MFYQLIFALILFSYYVLDFTSSWKPTIFFIQFLLMQRAWVGRLTGQRLASELEGPGSSPEITNFLNNICGQATINALTCPCSPSSVNWCKRLVGAGWEWDTAQSTQPHPREHLVALCNLDICSEKFYWTDPLELWSGLFSMSFIVHFIPSTLDPFICSTRYFFIFLHNMLSSHMYSKNLEWTQFHSRCRNIRWHKFIGFLSLDTCQLHDALTIFLISSNF